MSVPSVIRSSSVNSLCAEQVIGVQSISGHLQNCSVSKQIATKVCGQCRWLLVKGGCPWSISVNDLSLDGDILSTKEILFSFHRKVKVKD